jgi:hypothetical protein
MFTGTAIPAAEAGPVAGGGCARRCGDGPRRQAFRAASMKSAGIRDRTAPVGPTTAFRRKPGVRCAGLHPRPHRPFEFPASARKPKWLMLSNRWACRGPSGTKINRRLITSNDGHSEKTADSQHSRKQEQKLIRFENVGLRYGMGPEILRDISFHIPERSFQFLSGPSGAGKPPTQAAVPVAEADAGLITGSSAGIDRASPSGLPTLRRHRRGISGLPAA